MPTDLAPFFQDPGTLTERTKSELAQQMKPSRILAIADQVRAMVAAGEQVANFTIGDFSPVEFRVPPQLLAHQHRLLDEGETNYPPAKGMPALRKAVREYYVRKLGLEYPEGCVQIGSGARPLIFAAFSCLVSRGDTVLYQAPSWNVSYYTELNFAQGIQLQAAPENGFMLTVDQLTPHLGKARLLVINSPQNPSGTAISREAMTEICEAIVSENNRREALGERPLYLIYDMVYWQLTLDGVEHVTPVECVPEMAKYTILVDAISKSWSATGVRVGWAAGPPWLMGPMKTLVGHMGAWASRAAQLATAATLAESEDAGMEPWMKAYRTKIASRQMRLYDFFKALADEGLPVEPVVPEGALYLTARFPWHGRSVDGETIETDEDIRNTLLLKALTAVVPFTSFGCPEGTGWMRFSVGAVTDADIERALSQIDSLIRRLQ